MALLQFTQQESKGKTNIWQVGCNDAYLGIIKWYSAWRRYTFFPESNTLFDANCLKEITSFINEQMTIRKDGRT